MSTRLISKLVDDYIIMRVTLRGHKYFGCNFDKVITTECLFDNVRFDSCVLSHFDMQKTTIKKSQMFAAHLDEWTFDGDWYDITTNEFSANKCLFSNTTMSKVIFENKALFTGCAFKNVTFHKCRFKDVRFDACTFNSCLFEECVFSGLYSPLRPQLDTKVQFNRCGFGNTEFDGCSFNVREFRSGIKATTKDSKYSTEFHFCPTVGISFIKCFIGGLDLDRNQIDKCIFKDNMPHSTNEEKTPVVALDTTPTNIKEKDTTKDSFDCWDDYAGHGWVPPYGGWAGGRRNRIPKEKGKKYAYRFLSPGLARC